MKPLKKLAQATTPDGGEMELFQHDHDFMIQINGKGLMNSRQHESEMELARLGCAHLTDHPAPRVLIGGLGMGYTLRQTLDILGPGAQVTVSELLLPVVDWNRQFLGALNGHPLDDRRAEIITGDIFQILSRSKGVFDTILLDVDNGPRAITDSGNRRLYGSSGIQACRRALRVPGCLAIWSVEPSKAFEQRLMSFNFHVRRYKLPAYKQSKKNTLFVWIAAQDRTILPPGGGEPHIPQKKQDRKRR